MDVYGYWVVLFRELRLFFENEVPEIFRDLSLK